MKTSTMTAENIYAQLAQFGFAEVVSSYATLPYCESAGPNTTGQQQSVLDVARELLSANDFANFSAIWLQIPLNDLESVLRVGYNHYNDELRRLLEVSALPKLRNSALGDIATDIDILTNHGDATVGELTHIGDYLGTADSRLDRYLSYIVSECLTPEEEEMFDEYCEDVLEPYEVYTVLSRYN